MGTVEKVRIYSSLLRTGQITAEAVTDENGLLLVGEGTEITERHISLIRASEIKSILVERYNTFSWQEWVTPQERISLIKQRFKDAESSDFMKAVESALIKKITEKNTKSS